MGSAFHQLCSRYSGTLTPTAPTAIRLWAPLPLPFIDLDEVAHNEPPHLDLHCLPSSL